MSPVLCVLTCALAAGSAGAEPTKFVNAGYVGWAYDAFLGNPHSTGTDPGFKTAVLDLSYSKGGLTVDGRHLVPDNTHAVSYPSCSTSIMTRTIHGATSLAKSLEVSVSTSLGYEGVAFSASADYRHVEKQSSERNSVFTESEALCTEYMMYADPSLPPPATADFAMAVAELPTDVSQHGSDAVRDFIRNYGTHFLSGTHMGGRFGQRSEFSEESWSSVNSQGYDIQTSIQYSGLYSLGIEQDTAAKREQEEKFRRASTSQFNFNVGGKYKPSLEEWIETVSADPMPVKYTLTGLDELVTTAYLPDQSDDYLAPRRAVLATALRNYCATLLAEGRVTRCDAPGPDPVICLGASNPKPYEQQPNCVKYKQIPILPWQFTTFSCPDDGYSRALRGLSFTHDKGHNKNWEEQLMVQCSTLTGSAPSPFYSGWLENSILTVAQANTPAWNRFECPRGSMAVGIKASHWCDKDSTFQRYWRLQCMQPNAALGYELDADSHRLTPWLQKAAYAPNAAELHCVGPNEVVTAVDFQHPYHHDEPWQESFRLRCTKLRAPFLGCPADLGTAGELLI